MWALYNDSFHSVVKHPTIENVLVVRARKKEHLDDLVLFINSKPEVIRGDAFPCRHIHIPHRDYDWRVFVSYQEYKDFLALKVDNIQYDNFKDSTKEPLLKSLYSEIWWTLLQLQVGRGYERIFNRGINAKTERNQILPKRSKGRR